MFHTLEGAEVIHASSPMHKAMAQAVCSELCSKGVSDTLVIPSQSRDHGLSR